jgi:hypothetical protein
MMRKRIFEVFDRNTGATNDPSSSWDFADDADFQRMDSYFTKFPDLFFAKPEDNYRTVD